MDESQPIPPTPPPSGGPRGSGGSDRDLIDAARKQAARGGSAPRSWAVVPPESIPGYEIVREIHRGGQGVVYLAIQQSTKRKVAIKVMRESPLSGSRGRARFEREVEILGQLNHPNIVSIIDSGESGGCFYYVMDYISGHPLDVWMSAAERTIDDTLRLFAKICEVVNVAHLKGVIHRDLKPGNIRIDSAGEPHILDFGLAKTATGDVNDASQLQLMTMTGQFIGSLPWASPEQAEGAPDKVDVRTDVYSLGVVMYQMLTGGKFPYQVIGNMREVLDNILKAEPARPSTVRRQVNDEVETIVLKSLSKERERRYQSAGELGRDVRRYLAGEPVEAKRDSGLYVARKLIRRHRIPAAVVAGFLLLLIGFAIAMTALRQRALKAERLAVQRAAETAAARDAEAAQRLIAEESLVRARTNFDAVRALARTFMFDFNDEVRDLRGATRARALILESARRYLDQVKAGASDDPSFRRELAEAHDRVGDILGGSGAQRLGNTEAASAAYTEARRLREELLASSPADAVAQADVARSLAKSAFILRQRKLFDEARTEYERALAAIDRALGLAASPDAARRMADQRVEVSTSLGDLLQDMGQQAPDHAQAVGLLDEASRAYADAARHWRARVAADPADSRSAGLLAAAEDSRSSAAIQTARKIRDSGDALAEAGRKADAIARYEEAIGRLKAAAETAAAALADFERLSAEQPASLTLRRGVFVASHNAGEAHMRIATAHSAAVAAGAPETRRDMARASHQESLRLFLAARNVAERLASADEANLEAQRELAKILNKVGNEHRDLGDIPAAVTVFERSLAIRRETLRTDPTPRHRQDLAVALYKRGEIESLLADSAGDPAARRAGYKAAEGFLQQSLEQYTSLQKEGVLPADAGEIRIVNKAVGECREKLRALGG